MTASSLCGQYIILETARQGSKDGLRISRIVLDVSELHGGRAYGCRGSGTITFSSFPLFVTLLEPLVFHQRLKAGVTVCGILFAFLLLREVPSLRECIGAAVIIAAVLYAQGVDREERTEESILIFNKR